MHHLVMYNQTFQLFNWKIDNHDDIYLTFGFFQTQKRVSTKESFL